MVIGSLFSGIDGFSLAAHQLGMQTAFFCEINKFAIQVIKRRYGNEQIIYRDITKADFTQWHNKIDILCGGFPCQPHSVAGKRAGENDPRHLWPHMFRAVREIRPKYVLAENVAGLLSSSGGLAFEQVCVDLESEGYEVVALNIPACAVGAWHRRERLWFVAILGNPKHKGHAAAPNWRGNAEKFAKWLAQKQEEAGQFERAGKQYSLFSDTDG